MAVTRVTVCLTHPVQYLTPWFRDIAACRPQIELTAIYAAEATADQQGTGFGESFTWDTDARAGYHAIVLQRARDGRRFDSESFFGVDAPEVDVALRASAPDVALIPGWHSAFYLRALRACRNAGIPVLYRGDTHLGAGGPWWRRPLWRVKTRAMLRLFDGYLAVGARSREYLRAFGVPEPLIVASPHAVDNEAFAAQAAQVGGDARRRARAALGLAPDGFVVAFAGKFLPNKRPQDVISAAAQVGAPVSVLMIGSGPLDDECRAAAGRLGVNVAWTGHVNQGRMGETLALADCLVLPSARESWGLVVNEAMACGVPCIVSDTVGCAPDMVTAAVTGETFRAGDVPGLAAAIRRLRERRAAGHDFDASCRDRARAHSFAAAADGLEAGARRVLHRAAVARSGNAGHPRILACFGGMVIASGIERMSFEVLRVLRERGAAAHCVVNRWDSSRIVDLAEQTGVAWSTGYYWYPLHRHTRNPIRWAQLAWDVACTSAGLLRNAWRFRPTHVFAPEFAAVLRNAPALWILRRLGVPVVLRLGNAPDEGRFYRSLWRRAIDPLVDRYVSNSQFIHAALMAHGIGPAKALVVHNTAPTRPPAPVASATRDERRIIFVGQIIPQKGVDLLLAAAERLVALGYDPRVDIVGDMDGWESPVYAGYRAWIRDRAAASALAGRVRLLGAREDVPALLAQAGVHCCPSRPEQREGFAVVNLEAKRAGIPSVVFPTGSLPEMIAHGVDGWICRDVSVDALVEGLAFYLANPNRRRAAGHAALQSELQYNRARFGEAWAEVFGIAVEPARCTEAIA